MSASEFEIYIPILMRAKRLSGGSWRKNISYAWSDGNYRRWDLGVLEGPLQRLRNSGGRAWMWKVKLPRDTGGLLPEWKGGAL